jgi:DNA-binding SARP family transcriptional activator/tetratricopeptide (TPR) repeat protein
MFRLKLFGGAVIEGPAGMLGGRVAQRRRIALLASLAAGRGRPISRDKLLAVFWPEAEPERARHYLSDSVYVIRRELGDAAIVSAGADLRLDASIVSCDVVEFEDAVREGRLEQAAALYRGPFMDGFYIDDAPEFENWLAGERDRLARVRSRLLETLAQTQEEAGAFTAAADWWLQLAAHEPASGRIALGVMRALDAAGDRAGAIQHGRTHALIVREQFAMAADPEVTALAERLRASETPRAAQGPPPAAVPAPPAAAVSATPAPSVAAVPATPAPAPDPAGDGPRIRPPSMAPPRRRAFAIVLLSLAAVSAAVAWLFARETTHDVILVADAVRDTVVGDFISERLRQVLSRSPRLTVMGRPAIEPVLQRMGRPAHARLAPDVAREVALREGLKAFVRVDILASGEGRYLSAALVSVGNGELLDSEAIVALNATDVVAATDQLAKTIAERFPARLQATERRERLYPVTTDSIRALLLHMEAFLAYRLRGDVVRAIELVEEAIAVDPEFAKAWLHLHLYLTAQGTHDRRSYGALVEAHRLRERLSPYERYLVEAEYDVKIDSDLDRALDRYRRHIAEARKFGRNQVIVGFLPLASLHISLRDLDAAERVLQDSRTWFPGPFNQTLLARVLYSLERDEEAWTVLEEALRQFPANSWTWTARAHRFAVAGDFAQAHALALGIESPPAVRFGLRTAALFDAAQGRVAEAATHLRELRSELLNAKLIGAAFSATAALAQLQLIAGDTAAAVQEIDAFLAGQPPDSVAVWGQPALLMTRFFARANQPQRAGEFLADYEAARPAGLARHDPWLLRQARAALALANRDPERAIDELRSGHPYLPRNEWFEEQLLPFDSRPELARAFAQAGQSDSAIAVYVRYLDTRALFRAEVDAFELATVYDGLAALHETRREFARAAGYHRALGRLWQAADPPLRRRAAAAMRRAAVLETFHQAVPHQNGSSRPEGSAATAWRATHRVR